MGKYKIIWRVKARRQYIHHLSYAYQEFGTKAFYKWVNSVQDMEDCLEDRACHPVTGNLFYTLCVYAI